MAADNNINVPFHRPEIGMDEVEAVTKAMLSGWLTTGPASKEFEAEVAGFVGAKHAVALNSCTAALHLALSAVGLKEGEHVIVPSMTFAATAEVASYFKAIPSIVDIEPRTMNISPEAIKRKIVEIKKSGGTVRAVLPVHFAGLPCDMDAIGAIAKEHDIHVIEDAAHAIPSSYKGRPIGGISDVTCFSFYATKTVATGEGGMAVTDDQQWAEHMRVMSLHGISKDAWKRYSAEGSWYYEIDYPGFKYNMTDTAAAMGLVQLKKAEQMRLKRQAIADTYDQAFAKLDKWIETPARPIEEGTIHSHHLYVLRLNLAALAIDRAAFIEQLRARGVMASVHFIPLHIHPYYRNTFGYKPEDLPVSYEEYMRAISLPIFPSMSSREIAHVTSTVADLCKANDR